MYENTFKYMYKHTYTYIHEYIYVYVKFDERVYPRVEWRGFTAFARRNNACVFRKLIYDIFPWNLSFLKHIL